MEIIRQNDTELLFKMDEDQTYDIYYNHDCFSNVFTFLKTCQGKAFVIKDVDAQQRTFFQIKSANQTYYLAERLVNIPHVTNLRDIGGYVNKNGKIVKWGMFYRGAAFHQLDEQDKKYIEKMKMQALLDLRSAGEVEQNPNKSLSFLTSYNISGLKSLDKGNNHGNLDFMSLVKMRMQSSEPMEFPNFLEDGYRMMPFNNDAYKKMFEILLNQQTPLYWHCSAGKDRTGVAAMLILLALGVDRKTIMEDYLLSNVYREKENQIIYSQIPESMPDLMKFAKDNLGVNETYLNASFAQIDEKYGNDQQFLEVEYGLDAEKIQRLQDLYLY